MTENKASLFEHRKKIQKRELEKGDAYTFGIEKDKESRTNLVKSLVTHLKKMGYKKISEKKDEALLEKLIDTIFELQGKKPFYYIEVSKDELPTCWNRHYRRSSNEEQKSKDYWKLDYIKYEWGHLKSKEQHSEKQDISVLSLQSGRCNNQLQSSLDAEELCVYGGKLKERIESLLERFENFYNSPEGKKLVDDFKAKR